MNNRQSQRLSDSAADFLDYVWPAICPHLGGGSVEPVEAVTAEGTTRSLDTLAGIDVWHYLDADGGMRGIGSRVQWLHPDNPKWASRWPWCTFTVRSSLPTGNATEYHKRLDAVTGKRGVLYPYLTVQAYVHERRAGPLDAVATVRTEDLIRHIAERGAQEVPGCTGERFYAVPWSELRSAGCRVEVVSPKGLAA